MSIQPPPSPSSQTRRFLVESLPSSSTEERVTAGLKRAFRPDETSSAAAEPLQKKPRLEFTVPKLEVQVQFEEGKFQTFHIPKNALLLLSPFFKKAFIEMKMSERSSGVMRWVGPQPTLRQNIHPAAAEHILQFARCKSGFMEEKDISTLADLKRVLPREFETIFFDISRLSTYFEIDDLKQLCVQFLSEEIQSDLPAYFQWALQYDQQALLRAAFRSLSGREACRLKLYPLLSSIYKADGSDCSSVETALWQRLVHQCFFELLPQDAEGLEIIELCKCFAVIFPHFEVSREILKKIGSYDLDLIYDYSMPLMLESAEAAQAFYVVALSQYAGDRRPPIPIPKSVPQDRILRELHLLLSCVLEGTIPYEDFLKEYPENMYAMQALANLHFENQDYPLCMQMCAQILRLKPDHVDALVNRSRCHYKRENPEAAFRDINQAIEINPNNAWGYSWRAQYHFSQGSIEAAIQDLDLVIALEPSDFGAWMERGDCQRAKGDVDAALNDFKQALRLQPNDGEALIEIARIYLYKNKADASLKYLRQVMTDLPNFWVARLRGECFLKKGDFPQALEDFSLALEALEEPAPATLALRGKCHFLLKDPVSARKDLDEALKIDPACEEALAIQAQFKSA